MVLTIYRVSVNATIFAVKRLLSPFRSFLAVSVVLTACHKPVSAQGITAIWANTGEDKVTRDELRATNGRNVLNSVWDGSRISIFGARNEVVSFNLILESASGGASNVSVTFNRLDGPSGSAIASAQATGNGVFNWVGRPIELFFVRYLQIKGLSKLSYDTYDERHVPERLRRPWSGQGAARGGWSDRPDHDKFYPDIAVPLELVPTFSLAGGQNQSIWVDVYIPKNAPAGYYVGQVLVQEGASVVATIPVQLTVYGFTLPDTPSSKSMIYYSADNINHRYLGAPYVDKNSPDASKSVLLRDRHYMVAHRHRLSLIGDATSDCASTADQPCPESIRRLNGSLFSSGNGYEGPGANTGENVYSIGTYGVWPWDKTSQAQMTQHCNGWSTYFSQNLPSVEYFLYLIDESNDTQQIETWSQWIRGISGPGRQMKSLATISLPTAAAGSPSLDIPTSGKSIGITSQWEPLAQQYTSDVRRRYFQYAGSRPGAGSTATEDDGVAQRQKAWAQYKKKIQRWFNWESTYYNNYQGGMGQTNVFQTAMTFGTSSTQDAVDGQTGWNYTNGDGVLFYPGTDKLFPGDSYNVEGPFASLRLKHWRRGVQDVDYLTLAQGIDSAATKTLVDEIIPKVLWEYGVDSANDPTYVHTDISWSSNPDVWEAARLKLAQMIAGAPEGGTTPLPAPTLRLPSTLPVTAEITADYPSGYDIRSFQWSFLPQGSQVAAVPSADLHGGANAPSGFTTLRPSVSLAPMNLLPGNYTISVAAIDDLNRISPSARANVTLTSPETSKIRVYPNPWRADRETVRRITLASLPAGSSVKIMTISGHLVKRVAVEGTTAVWDLTNEAGDSVASGIYLYLVQGPGGESSRGKMALMQ